MRKTVLVIFGGNSTEHDISIISGVQTLNAMPIKGYQVIPIYIKDGKWYTGSYLYDIKNFIKFDFNQVKRVILINKALYTLNKRNKLSVLANNIDCALLATHGGDGENGCLQGCLEMSGIPYTSSGVKESAICMDKIVCKELLKSMGVNVVDGIELKDIADTEEVLALEERLNYPMIVKPACQGSSIGITLAKDIQDLTKGITLAKHFDKKVLVEKALTDFIELNCGAVLLDGELVISDIEKPLSASEFLTYDDKYMKGVKGMYDAKREFPARIDDSIKEEIRYITKKVYTALNLFGVVRMDFLVQGKDIYLNEINTIPGSLAYYLFPHLPQSMFLRELIESTIAKGVDNAKAFASNVLSNAGGLKHK